MSDDEKMIWSDEDKKMASDALQILAVVRSLCTVFLCHEHHTGKTGVHFNKDLDMKLKTLCQEKWEETFGDREEFRQVFGKSWL